MEAFQSAASRTVGIVGALSTRNVFLEQQLGTEIRGPTCCLGFRVFAAEKGDGWTTPPMTFAFTGNKMACSVVSRPALTGVRHAVVRLCFLPRVDGVVLSPCRGGDFLFFVYVQCRFVRRWRSTLCGWNVGDSESVSISCKRGKKKEIGSVVWPFVCGACPFTLTPYGVRCQCF